MAGLGQDVSELIAEEESAGATTQINPNQLPLFELETGLTTMVKAVIVLVGLGVASLAVAFVDWLQQLVPANNVWLGWFFKGIDKAIQKGVQVLTQAVGSLYNGASPEVGQGFHEIAQALKLLGADVFATAFTTFKTAEVVVAVSKKKPPEPIARVLRPQVKVHTSQIHTVTKKVVTVTKLIPRAVPRWIPVRIHHLETEVKRQQVEITQLQKQVKQQPHPSTIAQAVPVVALGLAGLGLNAMRCEGAKAGNQAACELGPDEMGQLLGLLGGLAGLLTLREYTQAGQQVMTGTALVVKTLLRA